MKIQPLRKSDSFSLLLDNPSHVTSHSPTYELISIRTLAWYYPWIHISRSRVFTQHRRSRSSGVSRWVVIVFHLRANFSCFNKIAWKMYGVCFYSLFFGLYFQTFIFSPFFLSEIWLRKKALHISNTARRGRISRACCGLWLWLAGQRTGESRLLSSAVRAAYTKRFPMQFAAATAKRHQLDRRRTGYNGPTLTLASRFCGQGWFSSLADHHCLACLQVFQCEKTNFACQKWLLT